MLCRHKSQSTALISGFAQSGNVLVDHDHLILSVGVFKFLAICTPPRLVLAVASRSGHGYSRKQWLSLTVLSPNSPVSLEMIHGIVRNQGKQGDWARLASASALEILNTLLHQAYDDFVLIRTILGR